MTYQGQEAANKPTEQPALSSFESQLAALIGDYHSIRQQLQGVRARAHGDMPESDPPQPAANKVRELPAGAIGRINEQIAELRILEGAIREHVARLGAVA